MIKVDHIDCTAEEWMKLFTVDSDTEIAVNSKELRELIAEKLLLTFSDDITVVMTFYRSNAPGSSGTYSFCVEVHGHGLIYFNKKYIRVPSVPSKVTPKKVVKQKPNYPGSEHFKPKVKRARIKAKITRIEG